LQKFLIQSTSTTLAFTAAAASAAAAATATSLSGFFFELPAASLVALSDSGF
jgi:hypothetical protein